MGVSFYFSTALKNIRSSKKQSLLYTIGIIISVSLLLSLQLWGSTAEDLAAEEFLQDQDYEMKITTYFYQDIPGILSWLNQSKPLVDLTSEMYYNIAFFNAEEKPISYRFLPENAQENMSDPLSLTSLGLYPKNAISRISSQFSVRGEFDLEENEVLISEYEANELEKVYGYAIEPGMQLNLSIARRGPELGEVYLYHCDLKHFYNVTVRGIYRPIPRVSMLQKTFSSSFLKDSIIFLRENMDESDINIMKSNGLEPVFMVKCNIEELKKDGIGEILNKLEDVADRLKISFQSSQTLILETPTRELQQSYSVARTGIIVAVPVIITSIILSVYVTNIVIESRKKHIDTLKDRGGQKWQIIVLLLLEFSILTIIGLLVSVLFSYIIASLIPAFASGIFTWEAFTSFMSRVIFPYSVYFYAVLITFSIISGFTIYKSLVIFSNNLEEKQKSVRAKIQNAVVLASLTISIIITAILLLIYGIRSQEEIQDLYNFTLQQTQQSITVFLMILLLIILISVLASIGLTKLLGKFKRIYNKIFPKNSFFVSNNLKSSKLKLSSLVFIIIILTSINVFSMNLYMTNSRNETAENYYNNGADLRIQTSYVEYSFADNISSVEGISNAIPALYTDGRLIYNSVTVIGINPIIYYEISHWEYTDFDLNYIQGIFELLNQTERGAIISDVVANRLNITQGEIITVTGLPNGSYIETFNVTGILHSAPGFGLSYGSNLEVNQVNEEFLFINEREMREDFAIFDTNLFFAKLEEGVSLEDVSESLFNFADVISINPHPINEQFVGQYIDRYIPNINSFLLAQIILLNLVGILIIITNINFLLSQRKKYNAILNTIGNSNKNLAKLILSELMIVNIASLIAGIIIGIPFAALAIFLNRPIFTNHNILPYIFTIDYIRIPIFILSLLYLSALTIIPSYIQFTRENIAITIRDN
ncbi:MAG: FtsX-like permease family protein [Candidatus Thorarchaeota archaeon]